MLIQQENILSATSHQGAINRYLSPRQGSPTLVLEGTDGGVHTKQPVLALQVGSDLDPGLERKHRPNEDTILVTKGLMPSASPKPFVLLMVADGMGGQAHGQEASQLGVHTLAEYVLGNLCSKQMASETFLPLLKEGVESANRLVYQHNREQRDEMGTTMTATLIIDAVAYVAHVGDSRFYLYRKPTGLVQLTQDHSLVAALAAAGVIQPEAIYTHPMRNQIYRSLGEKASVQVDAFTMPLAAGDILLLCSDGLWEMVRDPQIAAILTTPMPTPSDIAHDLIQAALDGGGVDNVSAIVVQVSTVSSP